MFEWFVRDEDGIERVEGGRGRFGARRIGLELTG